MARSCSSPSTTMVPVLTLFVAMLSLQSGAAVAKGLLLTLGAFGTTVVRLVLAAVMLALVFRPWRQRIAPGQLRFVALYGVALGLMNLTFYMALTRIPLGIGVALEFVGPLGVALWSSRRPLDFVWAGLAAGGIGLLVPWQSSGGVDAVGAGFALLAGAFWACYIVFGKRAGHGLDAGVTVSWGMVAASVAVVPCSLFRAETLVTHAALWPAAVGVAFLSSALPYVLEMRALKELPQKNYSILMSLEPAIATLCGVIWLGEWLSAQQLLAITCIVIAAVGSSMSRPNAPQRNDAAR